MKNRIYLVFVLSVLLGCTPKKVEAFSCDLKGVSQSSILELDTTGNLNVLYDKNFGTKLAIISPNGKTFFIVDDEAKYAQLKEAQFIKSGLLAIIPQSLKASFWNDEGKEVRVDVFVEKGLYTIYQTNNLETEFENADGFFRYFCFE